jgi:nitrate/nitrite-specific signal transduction histidine kinase
MKSKFTYTIIFTLFLFIEINAQTMTTGAAINKAGKQRMLTYRMAKNYIAIGAGIKTDEALKEMDEAASIFNENFNDLMIFAKNKEVKDALNVVAGLWAKFRLKAIETPVAENALVVIADAGILVNACNNVVEKIMSTSGSKIVMVPNMCGRQRMLSQKMAVFYLAAYWKLPYPNLSKELSETMANFDTGLSYLLSAEINNEETTSILKLQQGEWEFLKKSLNINTENLSPGSIYSSTNLLLKNFDRLTGMYEKLL